MYNQNNNKDDRNNIRENIPFNEPKTSNKNFTEDKEKPKHVKNIPNISLPKGGGAIKSIDEKFTVNPSNGTSSFNIPLPFSKSRSDFSPTLSLGYNSGNGNGIFGLGWDLEIPSIQRKTNKQLPQYKDEIESDVFLLSGVEDLVPKMRLGDSGEWYKDEFTTSSGIKVKRYRPRIESGFDRIEKINDQNNVYWKITTRDNIVTIFGKSSEARIYDPADDTKIFQWLPELSYDDKGNCIEYEYIREDFKNVPSTLYEKNRHNGLSLITNKYLKKIKYGNKNPYYPTEDNPYNPEAPLNTEYFFEAVLDYGEHDELNPQPDLAENLKWGCRKDPFSVYRSGFEIRTYRLCQRILFFHYFVELSLNEIIQPYLVRSLNFKYRYFKNIDSKRSIENVEADYITSIQQFGYRKNGNGEYDQKGLPPMEFQYHELEWNKEIKNISIENTNNTEIDIANNFQWMDFYNEGIPGIFTEQEKGWYYKSNLGEGNFSPAKAVDPKPSFTGISNNTLQIQDLEANGKKFIVSNAPGLKGYFEQTDRGEWMPFAPFEQMPNINFNDPNVKFIDLNGDGMVDLLVSEDEVFTWYSAKGKKGYDKKDRYYKPFDEEMGPRVVFAEPLQTIFLADMNGDGLIDIVRIRNGDVCYWPNLGYGRFGAKISMSNSPYFDTPDAFNPAYLHLADVSGTGATDILYLGQNKFKAWINLSGNAWSEPQKIEPFFPTEIPNKLSVIDLLGNGTPCIVWSSTMPKYSNAPMQYIDLMGGKKPYIMCGYKNNMGKETTILYKSSSLYYLKDKNEGKPWITKLPFPVQCVSQVQVRDTITNTYFTNKYEYHHGYYDHEEQEFRGFGRVEQIDTETYEDFIKNDASNIVDKALHQPPVLTRTWYHTGAFIDKEKILKQFQDEYYKNTEFIEYHLPEAKIETNNNALSEQEFREAIRACKGQRLRQEIYALDNTEKEIHPYSAEENNCNIRLLQSVENNKHAVFMVNESESITYNYERSPEDPRIAHTLNLKFDNLGNVLKSASVVYPRAKRDDQLPSEIQDEQGRLNIILVKNDYTKEIEAFSVYRLPVLSETKTYELTGIEPNQNYFSVTELLNAFKNETTAEYHQTNLVGLNKRIIEHVRTLYFKNDLTGPLPLGKMSSLGLVYETYELAFTKSMISSIYGDRVDDSMLEEGKYYSFKKSFDENKDEWWIPSGRVSYPDNPHLHFYLPNKYIDSYGYETEVSYYKDYNLLVSKTKDPLKNITSIERFDFRVLSPEMIKDMNDNYSEVRFDILGFVVGIALKGKNEADDFDDFKVDLTQEEINEFLNNPEEKGADFLQHATSRFVYDFTKLPAVASSIVRETHYARTLQTGIDSKLQYSFEYSDGMGNVVMNKIQAEPGMAKKLNEQNQVIEVETTPRLRWVGNGRTVLNNKGNIVKQYEPYFSVTHQYEDAKELVEIGVYLTNDYDPLDRLIKTVFPNGTFSKIEFDGWYQTNYDQNDTVNYSKWYKERFDGDLADDSAEHDAALKAFIHRNTPLVEYFDSMGRSIYTLEHNRFKDPSTEIFVDEYYGTFTKLDIEGNTLFIEDARTNLVMEYQYDMLSNMAYQKNMDAGERWMLNNVMKKPLYKWDARAFLIHHKYDELHRPIEMWVEGGDGSEPLNNLYEKIIYGEGYKDDKELNLRGKPFEHYDTGGKIQFEEYDFKENVKKSYRKLLTKYKEVVQWNTDNLEELLEERFRTETEYDALNRVTKTTTPDGSITIPTYNEANLLEKIHVKQGERIENFVIDINYNEKGQRKDITYGNGIKTNYDYDLKTFRLVHMQSRKATGELLQDLLYTYDPVGNITQIEDRAHPKIFFDNFAIKSKNKYTYDALYQLIEATGREHMAQVDYGEEDNWKDIPFLKQYRTNDPMVWRNYIQQYLYDATGNMKKMKHIANGGGWTREYEYETMNNRLKSTTVRNNTTYDYQYNPHHGFMTGMTHLQLMKWNFKDELQAVAKQRRMDGGIPETTYYVYDFSGQRIRKVTEHATNTGKIVKRKSERIYLDGVEIYREYNGDNAGLERKTLHVMDDTRRVAMVETRNEIDDDSPVRLIRYQYSNHLNTACLETDDNANVISYEEYHPYGTTSYQAVGKSIKAAAKRYRYTGKERDEESGLYYHGARYYVPWLGRWVSCDPAGFVDGFNLFQFTRNNPIHFADLTGTQAHDPENRSNAGKAGLEKKSEEGKARDADPQKAELRVEIIEMGMRRIDESAQQEISKYIEETLNTTITSKEKLNIRFKVNYSRIEALNKKKLEELKSTNFIVYITPVKQAMKALKLAQKHGVLVRDMKESELREKAAEIKHTVAITLTQKDIGYKSIGGKSVSFVPSDRYHILTSGHNNKKLKSYAEKDIANLTLHELGHALGIEEHSEEGIMKENVGMSFHSETYKLKFSKANIDLIRENMRNLIKEKARLKK